MTLPPHPTMRPQREALANANAIRSEHLEALYDGVLTPTDVVAFAARSVGAPLRSFGLELLLSAYRDATMPGTRERLDRLARTLENDEDLSQKSINWLLDPRAGGRRLLAWLDLEHPRTPPWDGFPWAPRPNDPPARPDARSRLTRVAPAGSGVARAEDISAAQDRSEAGPASPIAETRNPAMPNLLALHDDDRWRHEHALHSAGHALALVLVGHELTDDDLQSTLTLDRNSPDRPYVAAMGVLTLAAAWIVDIARDDDSPELDLGAVGDQIAWVLSNSGSCCYLADTESDLDDPLDEEGLDLLDDTDWVDDTVRVLLLKRWPAVEALANRWSAGERLDAEEVSAILRADYPPLWAETATHE